MNKETLKALKGSIKKWDSIASGCGLDGGTTDCPLCKLHISNCKQCPVGYTTYEESCDGSPYQDTYILTGTPEFEAAYTVGMLQPSLQDLGETLPELLKMGCSPTLVDTVEDELNFLYSLLPEGEEL